MFSIINFSLKPQDYVAILIFLLALFVSVVFLGLYRKYKDSIKRPYFLFSGIAPLFVGILFLLASFNIWGDDGRMNIYFGRVGVISILTALGLMGIIAWREG
jgi:amino acid transporter